MGIKVIKSYRNRHKGEKCFIVCNGPSLHKTDFSLLKNEILIGLNKIFLGFSQFQIYPKYYVAVNEKVLRQSYLEIIDLNCVKFISNRCPDLFSNSALLHIINTTNPPERFSKNIDAGLNEGWTVTYAALQIAYYLGFETVVIVGMDHRFEYVGKPNESNFLMGKDVNHFCENYFGNQEWDNPDLVNSEKSYRIAREVFESDGREIVDATVNGACEIFPKRSLSECVRG